MAIAQNYVSELSAMTDAQTTVTLSYLTSFTQWEAWPLHPLGYRVHGVVALNIHLTSSFHEGLTVSI